MNILATSTIDGITYHLIDQFTAGFLIDPSHVYTTLKASSICVTREECHGCAVVRFCGTDRPVSILQPVFPTLAETHPELLI